MTAPKTGTLFAALVFAAALSACAPTSPPPIITLGQRACAAVPDFTAAHPVPLDGASNVTVDIGKDTACWQRAKGGPSAYVLFALPDSLSPYLLTVTSEAEGKTLFAPRVVMFDGFGRVLREMPRTSFQYHGTSLYLGVRVYPDEKYAMVASDPQVVGKTVAQVIDGTQQQYVTSGFLTVTLHSGYEVTANLVYAVNGKVSVSAAPMPVVR